MKIQDLISFHSSGPDKFSSTSNQGTEQAIPIERKDFFRGFPLPTLYKKPNSPCYKRDLVYPGDILIWMEDGPQFWAPHPDVAFEKPLCLGSRFTHLRPKDKESWTILVANLYGNLHRLRNEFEPAVGFGALYYTRFILTAELKPLCELAEATKPADLSKKFFGLAADLEKKIMLHRNMEVTMKELLKTIAHGCINPSKGAKATTEQSLPAGPNPIQ